MILSEEGSNMEIMHVKKPSFVVIGKEGATTQGEGFIAALWQEANSHFDEVARLAKRDDEGNLVGIWGAMSDFSRSFAPWQQNFSQGLYLAGVECEDDAQPPEGWTRWVIPAFEYIRTPVLSEQTFGEMLAYLDGNGISLAGAVHDFTDPKDGSSYMYFPIERL